MRAKLCYTYTQVHFTDFCCLIAGWLASQNRKWQNLCGMPASSDWNAPDGGMPDFLPNTRSTVEMFRVQYSKHLREF